MARIAVVGLGNMGLPMAGNLVKAGHEVSGFDLVRENMGMAASRGVTGRNSPADAASGADAIVTMLPAGRHVIEVWRELVPAARKGALLIDSSTIDVASARAAHELAASGGLASLDAPVSGGVSGAEAATLTFMVGGSEAAFAAGKPIIEAMGRRVVHCGEAGAGQAAKICNNMMLGIAMLGVCEAFNLAEKLGLSAKSLFDVASTSSGQSWAMSNHLPVPGIVPTSAANRDFKPGFAAALMVKDLMLAQEAARSTGSASPMGAEAAQLFQMFVANGNGGRDYTAIIEFLRGTKS